MKMLKKLAIAGLVSVAVLAAAPAFAAPTIVGEPEIRTALAADGSVRVEVHFVTAWDGKQKPHWSTVPDGLVADLEKAHQAVLRGIFGPAALSGATAQKLAVQRSIYAPVFTATVTADQFAKLSANPGVVLVKIERPMYPNLNASLAQINAAPALQSGADGRGRSVAVIDTGVDRTHGFLTGKVVREACFSSNVPALFSSLCPNGGESQLGVGAGRNCVAAVNGCDHGTHVAGIVAGRNSGVTGPRSGVAPSARIVAIQAGSRTTQCGDRPSPCVTFTPVDLLDALGFVIERVNRNDIAGAPIAAVNMSLGGGRFEGDCDLAFFAMKSQIDHLRSKGVATVIASGNDDFRNAVGSPGCISSAVTVGSIDTGTNNVSSFSNISQMVDLLAPGRSIASSVPGNAFGPKNGTSMAAPHVAAAFADIRSRVPTATVARIQTALAQTGVQVRDFRRGGTVTRPRIDLGRALTRVIAVNPDVSVSPTSRRSFTKLNLVSFSPASRTFTISGTGSAFRYEVRDVPFFMSVNRTSGTIPAGGSFQLRFEPNLAAYGLPIGTYDSDVTIVNLDAINDRATARLRLVVR